MKRQDVRGINNIHFIGVGGVGMSGIARIAQDQGLTVSGSDLRRSSYTDRLEEAGITIFIGQEASNIAQRDRQPDVVVVSTAIREDNPELVEAKRRGIPLWHRAKMLAFLGRERKTLAVAGTHGKTTSSSMLAFVLDKLGSDPTFLIGGTVRSYQTNARCGSGAYYVVEADESDKSFSYLDPYAVVVTNVEADHLDHYSDFEDICENFQKFIGSINPEGVAVVCGDDDNLARIACSTGRRIVTYGLGQSCDYRITDIQPHGLGSTFSLQLPGGTVVNGSIKQNPGPHNVVNGSGVIALLCELGFQAQEAADALACFEGVRRRFDLQGIEGGVTVVDDYAHHPTEIAATISAAKQLDFKRVHVVFQPHRYSRVALFTEVLHDEFAHAFDAADTVTFTDVYSAGEMPVPGITGKTFLNVVLENESHPQATYVAHACDMADFIVNLAEPGDLVLLLGAGDIVDFGPQIVASLKEAAAKRGDGDRGGVS